MAEIKFDEVNEDRYQSMVAWCTKTLGRPALWKKQLDIPGSPTTWMSTHAFDRENGVRSETGRVKFIFKNDADATMFSLKWS